MPYETLHIVEWRGLYRVITERGQVVAVCHSYDEAEAYIAGQPIGIGAALSTVALS